MENWTIEKLLVWMTGYFTEKGVDSARLSAEMLLSHVLGMKRIELYMHFGRVVEKDALSRLRQLVKRAGEQEPIAYLVGKTEFYSMEIQVNRDCLIPRRETEMLVERGIEFLRQKNGEGKKVCDLCTGSGCIAVAIAKNVSGVKVIATDKSDSALKVASKNVEAYGLSDRVKLLFGDLFDAVIPELDEGQFDLITCNPPYVTSDEYMTLAKNVRDYEPKAALVAGADGLDVYRRIFERVGEFLKPAGCLLLEIGYSQGQAVRELAEEAGSFEKITVEKDFSNNDRVLTAWKTI